MQCPKCKTPGRRDGKTRGKQHWECKNPQRGYHYVESPDPIGAPKTVAQVNLPCPYCCGVLHKRSRRNAVQYYQCRDCGKGSCSA